MLPLRNIDNALPEKAGAMQDVKSENEVTAGMWPSNEVNWVQKRRSKDAHGHNANHDQSLIFCSLVNQGNVISR